MGGPIRKPSPYPPPWSPPRGAAVLRDPTVAISMRPFSPWRPYWISP